MKMSYLIICDCSNGQLLGSKWPSKNDTPASRQEAFAKNFPSQKSRPGNGDELHLGILNSN